MFSDDFFHPNHVVPTIKFVSAFMESSNLGKTEMLMELFTVPSQIFILCYGITNAGIQVQNAHLLKSMLQSFIQRTSIAMAF